MNSLLRRRRLNWKSGYTEILPRRPYQWIVFLFWIASAVSTFIFYGTIEGVAIVLAIALPPPVDQHPWGSKHSLWIAAWTLLIAIVLTITFMNSEFRRGFNDGFNRGYEATAPQSAPKSPTPTPSPKPNASNP